MATETRSRGRPRKAPQDQSSRQSLLRAGLRHLTEKGYSSVGLDEILSEADVPKGSFYYHFASKSDFGLALIAEYDAYFRAKITSHFSDRSLDPLTRLTNFIEDAVQGMERYHFKRGCLVGNLGQEISALPETFRKHLASAFQGWQTITADLFNEYGVTEPESLAAFFWTGWEGAVLRAKLELSPAPLRTFAERFMQLLELQRIKS